MCKLYLYQIQDDYQQQLRVNNGMTVLPPPRKLWGYIHQRSRNHDKQHYKEIIFMNESHISEIIFHDLQFAVSECLSR